MADTPKKTTKHHIDTNNLFVYLQTGRYLPGTNENAKRNLRKRAKSFKIIDEKLYYISCHSDNQGNAITAERLVIREKQEQMAIVAQLHVDDKGCHIGREKLTNKISEKYYFVGISTMVRDYISECTYCQIHRPSHRNSSDGNLSGSACSDAGDGDDSSNFSSSSTEESKPMTTEWMLSMQDPHRFWEIVEMNVIGPFSYDKSKYHIVVFMDVFSKWPEAYVVDTLTPSIITHLILNLVCRFGSMKTLTIKASQGLVMEDIYPREDILQKADLQINVNKQASSFSCPIWEEIKGSIQHFTDNNNQWPYCLEFALLPHRISRAESCEYTPSYITYGRELNLPPSLSHKDEDVSSNMFHAAEPHLTSAQMTSTRECLTEAYNMYGKFSEAAKPFCLTSSLTSLGKKQDSSNKTTVATSRRKRKSTFNVENIFKCDDSDDDITEKEIEEDMPPPSSASKEVLTGASKRKRSRRIRLIAQDSNDEDNPVEDKESKSQDDTKNVNYASGSKNEKTDLDKYYESIYLYKTAKQYPRGSSEAFKRVIRKSTLSYDVKDGKLFYKTSEGFKKVTMTWEERFQLLEKAHVDENGRHLQKGGMLSYLKNNTWKCLMIDCIAFIQACPQCCSSTSESIELTDKPNEKEEQTAMYAEEHYSLLVFFLQKGRFPANTGGVITTKISKIADNFVLQNGVLYYKKYKSSKERCLEVTWRHRKQAIKNAHELPAGTHLGYKETLERLREQYFWYKMRDGVSSYIRKCCNMENDASDTPTTQDSSLAKSVKFFREYFTNKEGEKRGNEDESADVCTTQDTADTKGTNCEIKTEKNKMTPKSESVSGKKITKQLPNVSNEVQRSRTEVLEQTNTTNDSCDGGSVVESVKKNSVLKKILLEKPNFRDSRGTIKNNSSDNMRKEEISNTKTKNTVLNDSDENSSQASTICDSSGTDSIPKSDTVTPSEQSKIVASSSPAIASTVNSLEQETSAPQITSYKAASNSDVTSPQLTMKSLTSLDPVTASAVLSILPEEERLELEKHLQMNENNASKNPDKTGIRDSTNSKKASQSVENYKTPVMKKEENCKKNETTRRNIYFKCEICGQVIRGQSKYQTHMYKHTGVKPFECDTCHKKFKQLSSMRIHKRKHLGHFSFLCNICGKGFTTACGLRSHMKLHEMGRVIKTKCELCDREFATVNRYERHMKFKHPAQIEIIKCEPCNKVFTTKRSLKRHEMSYHQGIRYHTCDVCGKSFFRKEYLTSHLVQHSSAANNSRAARKIRSPKTDRQTQENNSTTGKIINPMKDDYYMVQNIPPTSRIEYQDKNPGKAKTQKLETRPQTQIQDLEQTTQTILISTVNNEFYTIDGSSVSSVDCNDHQSSKTKSQALQNESQAQIQDSNLNPETILIGPVENEFYAINEVPPVSTMESEVQVGNTIYAITTRPDGDDEHPTTVVYGYPTVEYEVECGSGSDQVDAEALSAISMLAHASANQSY